MVLLLSAGGASERVVKMESVTGVALAPEPRGKRIKYNCIYQKKDMTRGK